MYAFDYGESFKHQKGNRIMMTNYWQINCFILNVKKIKDNYKRNY